MKRAREIDEWPAGWRGPLWLYHMEGEQLEQEVLYSWNGVGNTHQTCSYIREHLPELVPFVLAMECGSAYHTIVVFRAKAFWFKRAVERGAL